MKKITMLAIQCGMLIAHSVSSAISPYQDYSQRKQQNKANTTASITALETNYTTQKTAIEDQYLPKGVAGQRQKYANQFHAALSQAYQDQGSAQNAARQQKDTAIANAGQNRSQLAAAHIAYATTKNQNKANMRNRIQNVIAGYTAQKAALDTQSLPQGYAAQKKSLTDQYHASLSAAFQDHSNAQAAARQQLASKIQQNQSIHGALEEYRNTKKTNKANVNTFITNLTAKYTANKANLDLQYFPQAQGLINQKKQLSDQFHRSLSQQLQNHATAQDGARGQMDAALPQ